MIIEYEGTTVEVTKRAVKAWAESQGPEEWAGMTCDGEQCLLHNYIASQLPGRPHVFVGVASITIDGAGTYVADAEAADMIFGFDHADPEREGKDFTYGEVLAYFTERGVW